MKIKTIITAFLPLMLLNSCGNWLDVTPKGQVGLDKLFSSEQGFEDVLIGCYTSMTKKVVYGGELTYGTMDALAQYYKADATDHVYNETANFIYTGSKAKSAIEALWLGNYYTIANCNVILDNLQKADKGIFVNRHDIFIEAEAKALRAYLHFDLLRIFAPAWSDGSDLAIPYADKFQSSPFKQLNTKQVIDKVIEDLLRAKELLKDVDPVFEEQFKNPIYHFSQPSAKNNEFINYRAYRMNYFAVTATLARVYQYIGDKEKAYDCAKEVVDNKARFTFTTEGDFTEPENSRNLVMKNELLFALNQPTIYNTFADDYSSSTFYVYGKDMIYSTPEDFRKYLFKITNSNDVSIKYSKSSVVEQGGKIPMIRITEMFYIAAESIFEKDAQLACDYFNEARLNRGLSKRLDPDISYSDFIKEITLEYRREFLGEGQMFYRFKRIGGNMMRGNAEIVMNKSNYTLPLPATEVEFGDYDL